MATESTVTARVPKSRSLTATFCGRDNQQGPGYRDTDSQLQEARESKDSDALA